MAKDHTSFKDCPHCAYVFGAAERNAFVKAQFLEFLFCPNCNGKSYIVVPQSHKVKHVLTQAVVLLLAFLALLTLSLGAMMMFFHAMQTGDGHRVGRRGFVNLDVFPLLIIGGMVLGAIFVMKRYITRFISWQFSRVQKTPYVDA